MEEFLKILPNTFIPLFVAIDVFWLLSFFAPFVEGKEKKAVRRMVGASIITAFVASLAFTALGELIFKVVGITVDDFKVAGGLLLLVIAIKELSGTQKDSILVSEESGVVPLGVPLIVGPAVLATILVLVDQYGILATVAGLILNLLITWVALANAKILYTFLGKGFVLALSKIMAILLASIAVMMIRIGLLSIIG